MSLIKSVVFDLGNVLIDWNPRYLYRKLFPTEKEVEWFLENICDDEWNAKHDAGQPFSKGILSSQAHILNLEHKYTIGMIDGKKCWVALWMKQLKF